MLNPERYNQDLLANIATVCNRKLAEECGPDHAVCPPDSPLVCLAAEYGRVFVETQAIPTPEEVGRRSGVEDRELLGMAALIWGAYLESLKVARGC